MQKNHLKKLPIVDYENILNSLPTIKNPSKVGLAVSYPIFYSTKQLYYTKKLTQTKAFQTNICKATIWSAISFLKNTDLTDHNVRIYFHIEDRAYNKAMPVFKQFNVPDRCIRRMQFEKNAFPNIRGMDAISFGKKYMCLLDEDMGHIKNWLVIDGDFFACTTGAKIELYDVLNSECVLNNPTPFDYYYGHYEPFIWLLLIRRAAGFSPDPNLKEIDVFKRLGINVPPRIASLDSRFIHPDGKEAIVRPRVAADIICLPSQHAVSDFIRKKMWTCYNDEYLLGCYSLTAPFFSLNSLMQTKTYKFLKDYKKATETEYFFHMLYDTDNPAPFFSKFYRDLTTHVNLKNLYITEFENSYGKI